MVDVHKVGGDGASSGTIPVAAVNGPGDLSNAARLVLANTVLAVRCWSRHEWEALPAAQRPRHAVPTPDGRHWVAVDVTGHRA
jgi:hypothetical protein